MRYRELIEAPIADFRVVNKETDRFYNDFDKSDEGILNNPKGVQKIMNAFSKTPFEFNIYVIMRPTEGIWANGFKNSQIEAQQFLKDQIGEVQTEGRITCVFLSNATARNNRMPMNAWTIAHRIIHMMQTSEKYNAEFDILHFERTLWRHLVNIADAMTEIKPRFSGNMLQMVAPEISMTKFASCIMTQKSARDGRLSNSLDVGGEALAQYLLTGSIRFNDADVVAQRWAERSDGMEKPFNETVVNQMIRSAEEESMVACRDTLQNMVGNVFWF